MTLYLFKKLRIIVYILTASFCYEVVVADDSSNCFINVTELSKHINRNNVQVIDIRRPHDFIEYNIESSINLGLHEIESKPFLKRKHIVITGGGWDNADLATLCGKEIKQRMGSKISVLDGGVAAWFQGRIIKERKNRIKPALFYVSPSEVYRAKNDRFIPLLFGKDAADEADGLFPNAVIWDGDINNKLKSELDRRDNGNLPVLLISKDGDINDIDNVYRVLSPRNIYILKGGSQSYASFSGFFKSLRNPGTTNVKRDLSCNN